MLKYTFALAGYIYASFTTTAPVKLSEADILHLQARLPELMIVEKAPHAPEVSIDHVEIEKGKPFSLKQNGAHVKIHETWGSKLSPDFIHMLYATTRLAWLNQGKFPLHAACVGDDKHGYILLLGRASAGKTSTTLTCATELNLKIFSGDASVVEAREDNKLYAIGGTRILTIRARDKDRWPAFKDRFVPLGDRLILNVSEAADAPGKVAPIKAIAIIQLNENYNNVQTLSPLSGLHASYPYFMDVERSDILLDGGNDFIDGQIPADVKKKYLPKLSRAVHNTPTYLLTGSMTFMVDNIKKILDIN